MAKKEEAAKQQPSKEFDVEADIQQSVKISTDAAKQALDELAKASNDERVAECKEMIKETQYATKRQLLVVKRNTALKKIELETMKKICTLDENGKVAGGLLKDVLDGKLSKQEFEDKKREIIDDNNKEEDKITNHFDKMKNELRRATPGWVSGYNWFSNN